MQWCALHAVWLKDPAGLRVHLGLAYECRKTFARRRNADTERHSLQRPCSLVAATARQGDRGFFESFPSLSNDASPKSDTFAPCAKTPAGLKRHWGSCVTEERPMQAQAEYRRTVDDAVQRATRISSSISCNHRTIESIFNPKALPVLPNRTHCRSPPPMEHSGLRKQACRFAALRKSIRSSPTHSAVSYRIK